MASYYHIIVNREHGSGLLVSEHIIVSVYQQRKINSHTISNHNHKQCKYCIDKCYYDGISIHDFTLGELRIWPAADIVQLLISPSCTARLV